MVIYIEKIINYENDNEKIHWNHQPHNIEPKCCEKRLRVILYQLLPDIVSDIAMNNRSEHETIFRMSYISNLSEISQCLLKHQDFYTDNDIIDEFNNVYETIYQLLRR